MRALLTLAVLLLLPMLLSGGLLKALNIPLLVASDKPLLSAFFLTFHISLDVDVLHQLLRASDLGALVTHLTTLIVTLIPAWVPLVPILVAILPPVRVTLPLAILVGVIPFLAIRLLPYLWALVILVALPFIPLLGCGCSSGEG
ncbi:hypothetical protein DFO67_103273 [Modicisalibacter xianhensis]|uniref:Uncharacterized protein n=1 Tax=Modicisalibacter xianhensis TaxID=442341 RepID=A0A4R8FXH1_9GAMM|nr:hypothetical protein DFO67_103273 [Halomonas xianhensis]